MGGEGRGFQEKLVCRLFMQCSILRTGHSSCLVGWSGYGHHRHCSGAVGKHPVPAMQYPTGSRAAREYHCPLPLSSQSSSPPCGNDVQVPVHVQAQSVPCGVHIMWLPPLQKMRKILGNFTFCPSIEVLKRRSDE